MSKKNKLPQIVLFLFSIGLFILSMMQYSYVVRTEHTIRARFEKNRLHPEQLNEYYEQYRTMNQNTKNQSKNIPDVTLWNMKNQISVASEEYFSGENFSVIEGYGDLERIMPGQRIEGVYPPKDDTQGCAISDAGAKEVFGSSQILGKVLSIEDKEYIIRGIIKAEDHMLWIQNSKAEAYPYVELSYLKKTATSVGKEWLTSQGAGEPAAILAGSDYAAFNLLFLTLPLWLLFLYCCFTIKKYIFTLSKRNLRITMLILWIVCVIGLIAIGLGLSFQFTLDYIPKKWSDFSFYGTKVEQLIQSVKEIAKLKSLPGDVQLVSHSRNCAYLAWGSLVFMGGAIWCTITKRK